MGGMAEVELGKLASEKGTDPKVKDFGKMMITDHGKANAELKSIAHSKNIELPSQLDAGHKALKDKLSKLSGKEFDSSYSRNEPTSFPLNGVIPGWTEGLQLMNVGSKFKFFVPSKLAYADRGAGSDIGPNATLIFEVELLSIEGKK